MSTRTGKKRTVFYGNSKNVRNEIQIQLSRWALKSTRPTRALVTSSSTDLLGAKDLGGAYARHRMPASRRRVQLPTCEEKVN